MPLAGRFVAAGPTADPDFGTNESWVAYSEGDLTGETRLTLAWYGKAIIDPLAGESIVVACRGLPAVYGNGHFFWKLNIDGSMTFVVNATTQIIATTVAGVWAEDTPFSTVIVIDFNLVGQNKVLIYVNGSVVAWDAWSDGGVTAFENLGSFPRYLFGWRYTSGTEVQDLWIDYLAAWTGVAATAGQAAEYGGAFRVIETGTLGAPTHLFDFENVLTDTGSAPFSTGYNQNITFVAEAIHASPPSVSPTAEMFPKTSDTAGGDQVVVHANISLADEANDVDFRASRLPAGWTDSTSGTGTVAFRSGVTPLSGVRLSTRSTAGQVDVESGSDYGSFDAKMLVRCTTKDYSEASTVAHFSFNVEDVAQVRVTTDPLQSTSQFFVDGWIAGIQYAGFLTSTNDFELQIVRNSRWVFLLVNGIEIARSKRFSQDATGTLSFGVESTSQAVSSIFRKLEVRSHAIIGDRLIESKKNVSRYRISGLIPSAEVGTSDIMIFGPWGSATTSDPFVYTRPSALILGGGFVTY